MAFVTNIEDETIDNRAYRNVLATSSNLQLVVMSLKPREDIGFEIHDGDQFIRIESGQAIALVNGERYTLSDGDIIIIPAGARHNIINIDKVPLKLYTIYSPPQHESGTLEYTKPWRS